MKSYQIITNLSCNLRCTYCYEYFDGRKNTFENVVESLEAAIKRDGVTDDHLVLDFIGGEPFFVPDLLDEVMNYTVEKYKQWGYRSLEFAFSTNATLLIKPKQKEILEKYKDFITLGVSIDGDKEKHDKHRLTIGGKGSFDEADEGTKTAISILGGNRMSVKATFTKDSIQDYARSMKFILDRYPEIHYVSGNFNFEEKFDEYDGIKIANEIIHVVKYIHTEKIRAKFFRVCDYNGNDDAWIRPFKKLTVMPLKENRCGSCTAMTSVGFKGKVYGCNRFLTMDKPGMEMAEIREGKFVDLKNPIVDKVQKAYTSLPTACQSCRFNRSCSDCLAIPIDEGITHEEYYKQRRMCGYTKGNEVAKLFNTLINRRRDRGELSYQVN